MPIYRSVTYSKAPTTFKDLFDLNLNLNKLTPEPACS